MSFKTQGDDRFTIVEILDQFHIVRSNTAVVSAPGLPGYEPPVRVEGSVGEIVEEHRVLAGGWRIHGGHPFIAVGDELNVPVPRRTGLVLVVLEGQLAVGQPGVAGFDRQFDSFPFGVAEGDG